MTPPLVIGSPARRGYGVAVALVLLVAALPRLWAAVSDHSLFWCDEIHQSLEPAHRAVFRYGFTAWEFRVGARSWLFPGLFVGAWKLAAALGVRDAATLVAIAKLLMVAFALAGVALALRFGRELGGTGGALVAGALVAAFPLVVLLDHRALSEVPSATLLLGAAFLVHARRDRTSAATAGLLLGVAILCRYQNGVVAAGLGLLLLAERRWREALAFAVAGAALFFLGGALDWLTWGHWFQSAREYLGFHAHGRSAAWGVSPGSYYLVYLWRSTGPVLIAIAAALVLAATRTPGLVAIVVAYVALYSAVGHKELRYVLPIVPLALTLAGGALGRQIDERRGGLLAAALLAVALAAPLGWRAATNDFAAYDLYVRGSPWLARRGANRLLLAAGTRADLCGLALRGLDPWYTGGYTYLHRDVPFLRDVRAIDLAAANYVVAPATLRLPPEYTAAMSDTDWTLFRRPGGCAPPKSGYTRNF